MGSNLPANHPACIASKNHQGQSRGVKFLERCLQGRNDMKKSMMLVGFVLVAVLLFSGPALAQQNSYTIKVPFAFSVGMQTLPAGEYRVGEVRQGTVSVRGIDVTANAFVVVRPIDGKPGQPPIGKLVFHQYGRRYFLAQVWFEGLARGGQLATSQTELEYAKLGPKADTELLGNSK